jgi:Cyclic nucleotide-binding domain
MRVRAVVAVGGVIRRNSSLGRLVAAYCAFVVSEYACWVAVLVFAFARGGTTEAGIVAVVQLAPAAAAAPWLAGVADRRSPGRFLIVGYLAQAIGMAATAGAIALGRPVVAYSAAVLAATSVVTTRPAQMALLPRLAVTPEDLTAANIALGWADNAGVVVAGLLAGVLLTGVGPAGVLAVTTALVLVSTALVLPLHEAAVRESSRGQPTVSVLQAARLLIGSGAPRSLAAVLSAQWVVLGALDVLYVVLAVDVLQSGRAWVGFLQTAFGVGGVAAGVLTARLVGRRLSSPMLISGLLLGAALGATALEPGSVLTAVLLTAVGASRAVLDVAGRTLLQRAVPVAVLGGVFGLLEGMSMAGLAAGSLLVPLLVHTAGNSAALLGAAAIVPVAAILCAGPLLHFDADTPVATANIALLRTVPLFAGLPPPVLEGLAGELKEQQLPAGAVLLREGDPGLHYFIIGSGQLQVSQAGRQLRQLGAGEAVGEIALLRDIPRTATVTATAESTVYQLDREPFLAAVTGHVPTQRTADAIIDQRLAQGGPHHPAR